MYCAEVRCRRKQKVDSTEKENFRREMEQESLGLQINMKDSITVKSLILAQDER